MVFFDNTSVILTALILLPITLVLTISLNYFEYIPLGDLTNIIGAIALIVGAVRGNVFRALIISIPVIIINIKLSAYMAPFYTKIIKETGYDIEISNNGLITSFLNGGNPVELWIANAVSGNMFCIALVPIMILLLYILYKENKKYIKTID